MAWWRLFGLEVLVIFVLAYLFGYVKLPDFFRRKQLVKGFPWGYYPDQVPKSDPGYFQPNNNDFLHDVGTGFGGLEGFGEYGEFTGFGEMGEFGANFGAGGE